MQQMQQVRFALWTAGCGTWVAISFRSQVCSTAGTCNAKLSAIRKLAICLYPSSSLTVVSDGPGQAPLIFASPGPLSQAKASSPGTGVRGPKHTGARGIGRAQKPRQGSCFPVFPIRTRLPTRGEQHAQASSSKLHSDGLDLEVQGYQGEHECFQVLHQVVEHT